MNQGSNLLEGRVYSVHKTHYVVKNKEEFYRLQVSGRFKYTTIESSEYPVVGDYVLFRAEDQQQGIIEQVKLRHNTLERAGVSSTGEKQVIAANVDLVFICVGLDLDFNMKKIQNLLNLTQPMHSEITLVLTKKDLHTDVQTMINTIEKAFDYPILPVSIYNAEDMDQLRHQIAQKTAVFIGSSGVGKSSLVNALLNLSYMKTHQVRSSDSQGRHTTTHRELIELSNNGYVIDTPGIRRIESHIVDAMDDHFEDILSLAKACRFRNCTHKKEPGCSINEAINNHTLSPQRLEAYTKVLRLNAFHAKRDQQRLLKKR